MDYDKFISEVPEETRKLILKAIDIYATIENIELVCNKYDSFGKITKETINKIDKRCASLFLASLLVNTNMIQIMDDSGLSIGKFFEYFEIQNRDFKELTKEEYMRYFNRDYKKMLDTSKKIRILMIVDNLENKHFFPEYILSDLYYEKQCGSEIVQWMYSYVTNKKTPAFNHVSFKELRDNLEGRMNDARKDRFSSSLDDYLTESFNTRNNSKNEKKSVDNLDQSFFEQYGIFLTNKEYVTDPAIGREKELENLELAYLTPNKSVSIVGEAGTGKTSLVEGLAYRIIKGEVPALLKGKQILKIDSNSLVAGTMYRGQFEEKVKELFDKLKDHKEIILFIDEMHSIMGAGTAIGAPTGFDNIIKPYLDRGDVKIIGATTELEYKWYILRDEALKRRFEKVVVLEPKKEVCVSILNGTIPKLEKEMNIKYGIDSITSNLLLGYLVDITAKKYRCPDDNQNNPDLSLLILSKAFAFAAMKSKTSVTVEDIITSILRCERLQPDYRKKFAAIAFDNLYTTQEEAEKVPQFIKSLESCLYE